MKRCLGSMTETSSPPFVPGSSGTESSSATTPAPKRLKTLEESKRNYTPVVAHKPHGHYYSTTERMSDSILLTDASADSTVPGTDKSGLPKLDFGGGKLILAPMVRIGSLPMRQLCLKFGADIVFSPEIIDRKLVTSRRSENAAFVDYLDASGHLVLRTKRAEPLVCQIGSNDGVRCLKAANTVLRDVRGIDLNMGCPKHFSMHCGMGAALIQRDNWLKANDILRLLCRNVRSETKSVSCKIRCLPTATETVELCQMLAQTGIDALAVHCRVTADRSKRPLTQWPQFKAIKDKLRTAHPNVVVVFNGDVFSAKDAATVRSHVADESQSLMFARGAQWNASLFAAIKQKTTDGMEPLPLVVKQYLDECRSAQSSFGTRKYAVLEMLKGRRDFRKTEWLTAAQRSKCHADLHAICDAMHSDSEFMANERAVLGDLHSVYAHTSFWKDKSIL